MIYVTNIESPKFMKQTLKNLKGEVDSSTIIVGDINNTLSIIGRTTRQKVNKEIGGLINIIDQLNLRDIYRKLHFTTAKHIFL